jgi:ATP-dependent DNA helicase RecG
MITFKWVCGFANAQGGKIYIGMNDAATVVGVDDQKTLMEEIPNKIKNNMGIIVEVNLKQESKFRVPDL